MLRLAGLLVAAMAFVGGCSVDRIEWESTGFVVEEVRQRLLEEHHVVNPALECIKREVGGSLFECRGHTEKVEFDCEVKVGIREKIHSIECELDSREEIAPSGSASGRTAVR